MCFTRFAKVIDRKVIVENDRKDMIVSRTPYRISFFGGGTDYHPWYQTYGGAVISTTINHYCYLNCRFLPPFFEHKSRIVWSEIEHVVDHNKIHHPAVRAVLKFLNIEHGLEIHHQGDLPARSGLGSSSAFTVGILNALYALCGLYSSKRQLACEAVHVEREILHENVGVQDQIATAYGGLNKINIQANGDFSVTPLVLPAERVHCLQDHLLLFYTGISRFATSIAKEKIQNIKQRRNQLDRIRQYVDEAEKILNSSSDLANFGHLMHEAWLAKRELAATVSNVFIDEIYESARRAGALGGKILGAGGGGFILFFVPPEKQMAVKEALAELLVVPFDFENNGSQIIFSDALHYSKRAMERRDYVHLHHRNKTPSTTIDLNGMHEKRRSELSIIE